MNSLTASIDGLKLGRLLKTKCALGAYATLGQWRVFETAEVEFLAVYGM